MKKAVECFEQALNLHPDYIEVRIDLARLLRQLGRAAEALVLLEEAIDLDPNDGEAHISLIESLNNRTTINALPSLIIVSTSSA